jgi:hypothetical protein
MKPNDFDVYHFFHGLTEKIMYVEAKVQFAYDSLSSLNEFYQLLQKNER